MAKKRFRHPCGGCDFVGTVKVPGSPHERHDVYVCLSSTPVRFIARYGENQWDTHSWNQEEFESVVEKALGRCPGASDSYYTLVEKVAELLAAEEVYVVQCARQANAAS